MHSPYYPIGRSDGRCVQRAGTKSAQDIHLHLLEIPCSRQKIPIIYPNHKNIYNLSHFIIHSKNNKKIFLSNQSINYKINNKINKIYQIINQINQFKTNYIQCLYCSARAAQSIKGHHRPVITLLFNPFINKKQS